MDPVSRLQGSWRAVAERTTAYKDAPMGDKLVGAAWHIFALTKLRQYGSAADELAALGSLDSPAYLQDGPQGAPFRAQRALMMILGS